MVLHCVTNNLYSKTPPRFIKDLTMHEKLIYLVELECWNHFWHAIKCQKSLTIYCSLCLVEYFIQSSNILFFIRTLKHVKFCKVQTFLSWLATHHKYGVNCFQNTNSELFYFWRNTNLMLSHKWYKISERILIV